MQYQRDRQYSLLIGQGKGSGLLIDNLHIEFTVRKTSDNKKKGGNKATVSIYNLSEENQKYVEAPFVECVLQVGYAEIGIQRLFAGQVTIAGTRKHGPDVITELQIDTLYTQLNNKRVSKTSAPGSSLRSVIDSVSKEIPDVGRVVYSGSNINKSFIDGYPMTGTPREILNALSDAFQIEWQIDDGVLYIQDVGYSYMTDSSKAYVISETSGLKERPYFDNIEKRRGKGDKVKEARKGVRVKILLNPAIIAGSIVKIDYGEFTGFYKVESLTHRGGIFTETWETELICGTMLKIV